MDPLRCLIMMAAASLLHKKQPFRFTSTTSIKSFSDIRRNNPSLVRPELLIKTSKRPTSFLIHANISLTCVSSQISAWIFQIF